MKIVVPVNLVPDLVEELTINEDGNRLDTAWLSLILNEFDDHAIEQAISAEGSWGRACHCDRPRCEGADDVLYAALAKGADQIIKIQGDFEEGVDKHILSRSLAGPVHALQPDLVLTGVQAHDDLDGSVGPLLAGFLNMPYVGYIAGVEVNGSAVVFRKEYPGGLMAEMRMTLPAVLGIQAAEEPPRYVAFSRVRQAMKSDAIEELEAPALPGNGSVNILRMYEPETGERAEMIGGDAEKWRPNSSKSCKREACCERRLTMNQDIFVIAEHLQGQVMEITYVMLAAARSLAGETGGNVVAVLLGHNAQELANDFAADRVLYLHHPALAEFTSDAYLIALSDLITSETPRSVLLGHTSVGMDVASGLSVRLDLPLVSQCLAFGTANGALTFTSQICGGKIMAEGDFPDKTLLLTMLPGGYKSEAGRSDQRPEIAPAEPPPLEGLRVTLERYIEPEAGDVDITKEPILIAVGRGLPERG